MDEKKKYLEIYSDVDVNLYKVGRGLIIRQSLAGFEI